VPALEGATTLKVKTAFPELNPNGEVCSTCVAPLFKAVLAWAVANFPELVATLKPATTAGPPVIVSV
jgi:hypothetical protein